MPEHATLTDEIAELAASYALGILPAAERREMEAHLSGGCPVCEAEIARCGSLLASLTEMSSVTPPASLREKLLKKLCEPKKEGRKPVLLEERGLLALRTEAMDWKPGPSPGLEVKVLFYDPQAGISTMLVRMEAESRYPAHRHKGFEEVYVLDGSLQVEEVELKAGDFCVAQPESIHRNTYSRTGCVFMVKSSIRDEVLL